MRLTTKEMQRIAEENDVRLSVKRVGTCKQWGFHGFASNVESAVYSARNRFGMLFITRSNTGVYIQK